jgi:hypothetical protein
MSAAAEQGNNPEPEERATLHPSPSRARAPSLSLSLCCQPWLAAQSSTQSKEEALLRCAHLHCTLTPRMRAAHRASTSGATKMRMQPLRSSTAAALMAS